MPQNIKSEMIQEDENDFRELWKTITKRKKMIFSITIIITMLSAYYVWTVKPIYAGNVLIEVGEVIINSEPINSKPTILQPLENVSDVKEVVLQEINANKLKKNSISIDFPAGSNKLIKISGIGTDKKSLLEELQKSVNLVLSRQQHKAEFYKKTNGIISLSNVVGDIIITQDPIKPKKRLIITIGFVSGILLGVLAAFFMEFIQANRRQDLV
jgi:uncharacterized protein involved in exopolysaccharide biosynthesis